MSRAASVLVVFAALVAATTLTPTATLAQRGPGGGGGGGRGGVGGAQGTTINAAGVRVSGMGMVNAAGVRVSGRPGSFGSRVPGQQHHNRVGHHRHRGLVGFGPTLWYGYGGVPYYYPYYPAYAYYPQAYYDQAPAYVYVPPSSSTDTVGPPPPMQRVVEYPTGRYELRGDGYATPYHWIWIPSPPSAPPAPTPPATQPAPSVPPASSTPGPPAKTTVYRWTDAEGTVHFTDRLDSVPPQYRVPAKSPHAS